MSSIPHTAPAADSIACPPWCTVRHSEQLPHLEPDLSELVVHRLPTRLKVPGTARPMPLTVEVCRLDEVDRLGGSQQGRTAIVLDGASDEPLTPQEAIDVATALLEYAAIVIGGEA